MKLLKVKSSSYKGKQYHKFRVNIPEKIVKEAEFKVGDELEVEAKKGEVRLMRRLYK